LTNCLEKLLLPDGQKKLLRDAETSRKSSNSIPVMSIETQKEINIIQRRLCSVYQAGEERPAFVWFDSIWTLNYSIHPFHLFPTTIQKKQLQSSG